jgi:hypothetical protein
MSPENNQTRKGTNSIGIDLGLVALQKSLSLLVYFNHVGELNLKSNIELQAVVR